MQPRRRAGLRSFPGRPPAVRAYPASNQRLPYAAGCSRAQGPSGASPVRSSARRTSGATDNTSPRSRRSGGLRPPYSGPARPEHRPAAASQRSLQACIASLPLQSSWMSKTYLKSDHFNGGGSGELFKMMTGVDIVHVPYRGALQALTDLLSGQVQAMFMVPGVVTEHIKTGKLRAVAVTAATRSDVLPDVPTVNSVVTGYEATTWFGIGAPKNTPSEIVDKLNKEINAAVADPKIKAQLTDLGGTSLTLSPGEFGKLIADNTEKWGKVIRAANIKPE